LFRKAPNCIFYDIQSYLVLRIATITTTGEGRKGKETTRTTLVTYYLLVTSTLPQPRCKPPSPLTSNPWRVALFSHYHSREWSIQRYIKACPFTPHPYHSYRKLLLFFGLSSV